MPTLRSQGDSNLGSLGARTLCVLKATSESSLKCGVLNEDKLLLLSIVPLDPWLDMGLKDLVDVLLTVELEAGKQDVSSFHQNLRDQTS